MPNLYSNNGCASHFLLHGHQIPARVTCRASVLLWPRYQTRCGCQSLRPATACSRQLTQGIAQNRPDMTGLWIIPTKESSDLGVPPVTKLRDSSNPSGVFKCPWYLCAFPQILVPAFVFTPPLLAGECGRSQVDDQNKTQI